MGIRQGFCAYRSPGGRALGQRLGGLCPPNRWPAWSWKHLRFYMWTECRIFGYIIIRGCGHSVSTSRLGLDSRDVGLLTTMSRLGLISVSAQKVSDLVSGLWPFRLVETFRAPQTNKKAELPRKLPRDAPCNMGALKYSRVPDYAHGNVYYGRPKSMRTPLQCVV